MIAIIISFETIVEASSSCDDDGNHDGKTKKQVEVVVSQHQISTLHWPGLAAMCLFFSDWLDMLLSQWLQWFYSDDSAINQNGF